MCNMCTRTEDPEVQTTTVEVNAPPDKITTRTRTMIDRFKRKHRLQTDPNDEQKQKEVEYQPDLLAVSTQYTKVVFELIKQTMVQLKDTRAYVILSRTSQPFHVLLALLVLAAWLSRPGGAGCARAWAALYVLAVATHLGAQIWMTLVSGIVLYFALPRHEFGRVQTVLFPVYYAFNASVSLLAVLAYFRTQYLTNFVNMSWTQLALLLVVFAIEASVRLRLVKPMLRAKHIKTQMEETAGNGQEVGKLVLGELAHCPRYIRVLKTFRSYHSTIAMGTMLTLGCSFYSTMIIVDAMC